MDNRIDSGNIEGSHEGGIGAVGRQHREAGVADLCARRETATLPGALVIHEKESQLGIGCDRSTQAATKNILFD